MFHSIVNESINKELPNKFYLTTSKRQISQLKSKFLEVFFGFFAFFFVIFYLLTKQNDSLIHYGHYLYEIENLHSCSCFCGNLG